MTSCGLAMAQMAASFPEIDMEAQVFGRQPLAISMRCYHARAHGRDKDHCRFACGEDADGLPVDTLDGRGLLTVNGTQTLSSGYLLLAEEMDEMRKAGVSHFRLAVQDVDMLRVAQLYREALDGAREPESLSIELKSLLKNVDLLNGYDHGKEGKSWIASP